MSDDERHRFVVPAASGELHGIDLSLLDPDDPDHRSLLIEAEHPDLHAALDADREVIHLHGQTVNPRLHLAMHEVVANQLWANEPAEMWQTARRLLDAGYERHEVLHMLASVVSGDIYSALHDGQAHDPVHTRAGLEALPESWERQRTAIPEQRHANRAERRAAARKHRH